MDCYLLVIIKEDVWISTAGAELERLILGQVSNSVCWSVKSGHRSLFLLLVTHKLQCYGISLLLLPHSTVGHCLSVTALHPQYSGPDTDSLSIWLQWDEQACLLEKLMLNKCQNLCKPDGALALQTRDKQSGWRLSALAALTKCAPFYQLYTAWIVNFGIWCVFH